MLKILLCLLLIYLLSSDHSYAQNRISGRLMDVEKNEPLAFAQVGLMDADTSLITGAVSDLDGNFNINTNKTGIFLLRASFIGYEESWKAIEISIGRNIIGDIGLRPGIVGLDEVQVTAAAALFRSEADKRVFNVENMTISEGGTAIQLLETLPSVQVDEEGKLSMRGSGNILIYINGRPTNILSDDTESILEQYPASAIKEVELITNPSARYDAEGIGGIINLVLKEGRRQGMNGQINLSAGTGHKYTAGAILNYKRNRISFSMAYNYQYRELWEETHSLRERFTGNTSPLLDQDYFNRNYTHGHLFRNSLDYEINARSHARLFANVNYSSRERQRTYHIRSLQRLQQLDSMYVRYLDEDQSQINYELGLGYGWRNSNGRRLSFQASWAFSDQDRIEYFDQLYYDANGIMVPSKRVDQTYERPITNTLWLLQLDYEQPIRENLKLETGLKSTIRIDDREQIFKEYDFGNQQYITDDWVTNQFTHDEQIHAAYVILAGTSGRWQYQGGLRTEYTNTESYQPRIDSVYNYDYIRLFPSLFVNYKLSSNEDLQFSMAQRIRRPSVTALQPFINAQDFFNLRLGNPYLEPEHTLNTEINYMKAWDRYLLTAGVFNRHTTNALARQFILLDNATMVTWTNANTHSATGVEVINYLTLNNNFDATLTTNLYYAEISGKGEGGDFSEESYSWSLSLLSNLNIPRWFSTQITANYQGPQVIPNGEIRPVFSMNLGFRRNVMNQRGTLSLSISDVFNSRHFSLVTQTESFYQLREFNRESRIAVLSFTYRFQGYVERQAQTRRDSFNGDVEGLY
jgi:iron complex outermembrane recepter protein